MEASIEVENFGGVIEAMIGLEGGVWCGHVCMP